MLFQNLDRARHQLSESHLEALGLFGDFLVDILDFGFEVGVADLVPLRLAEPRRSRIANPHHVGALIRREAVEKIGRGETVGLTSLPRLVGGGEAGHRAFWAPALILNDFLAHGFLISPMTSPRLIRQQMMSPWM